MPRIQEYLPQENAAGPQGALSPNLEEMSAGARGIERFGQSIEEGADAIYTRQSQMETQQAFGDVSQQRVSDLQAQMQGAQDGTWDNDKYKQNFTQWQNDQVGNYETAAGKNTFMRQSNRLLGAILTRGAKVQSQIAANNAAAQYQSNVEDLATATRLAPDTFQDNLEAAYEHSMDLPEAAQPHADTHAEQTLAREAVLGVANTDASHALKMLQDKDFASYLDPKEMDSLYVKVRAAQRLEDEDSQRQNTIQEKASKARANQYATQNLQAIASGKLSPKNILLNAPSDVDFETRLALAEKAKQAQSLTQTTSPTTMRDIQERLLLPKDDPNAIVDISQLAKQPQLAPQDVNKLQNWYLKTPQGAAEKNNEKLMMNDIKGKLKVNGMPDQDYDNRVVNAMADYQKAKQQMINQGKDPTELTNPKSKEYFPTNVRAPSPVDLMQAQVARMSGQPAPTPIIVHASPGVIPPIERKDKNGKTWLYDATTKQSLGAKPGQ